MKALLVWLGTLTVLLLLLSFWAGAHDRPSARPVDPSIYGESLMPELPAISETHPEAADTPDTGPALTF